MFANISDYWYICQKSETKVNFYEFKNENLARCCFSIYGLAGATRASVSSNLSRWTSEGKLIKLRKGWYAFPERTIDHSDRMFIANSIYSPSYVSLFSALAYYEMIPEAVNSVSNVSTLKTADFISTAGTFSYRKVKPGMFFGYDVISSPRRVPYMMATAEKALLDLLYLYPEYSSVADIECLRLDEDFMREEFLWNRMNEYLSRAASKALATRVKLVESIYR